MSVVCLFFYLTVYMSLSPSVNLSFCLYVYLSIRLFVYMSFCLSAYLSICLLCNPLFVYFSICMSVFMSVCPSNIYLSVHLMSICLYMFIHLFRISQADVRITSIHIHCSCRVPKQNKYDNIHESVSL